jgi:hypothetical protein
LKMTEVAQVLRYFLHGGKIFINFDKKWNGQHFSQTHLVTQIALYNVQSAENLTQLAGFESTILLSSGGCNAAEPLCLRKADNFLYTHGSTIGDQTTQRRAS